MSFRAQDLRGVRAVTAISEVRQLPYSATLVQPQPRLRISYNSLVHMPTAELLHLVPLLTIAWPRRAKLISMQRTRAAHIWPRQLNLLHEGCPEVQSGRAMVLKCISYLPMVRQPFQQTWRSVSGKGILSIGTVALRTEKASCWPKGIIISSAAFGSARQLRDNLFQKPRHHRLESG